MANPLINSGDAVLVVYMPFHSFQDIFRLIVYGDVIAGHLWFLNSYFWTLLVFLFASKFNKGDTYLLVLSLIFLLVGLSERQYSFVLDFKKCFTQDFYIPSLSVSLSMMFLGYSFRKYEKIIEKNIESGGGTFKYGIIDSYNCPLYRT